MAALFTIAKTWKQPKCPSTDKYRRCAVYIYTHTHTHTQCVYVYVYIHTYIHAHTHTQTHTMEYYSVIKKNETMPSAATWMDLEIIILSEISQKRKSNTI